MSSYDTYLSGEVGIQPRIPHQLVTACRFAPRTDSVDDPAATKLAFAVDGDGNAVAVGPRNGEGDGNYGAADLAAELQAILDAFPDHTFTGYLYGEGENRDDMWRVEVTDSRRAFLHAAEICWPDAPDGIVRESRTEQRARDRFINAL